MTGEDALMARVVVALGGLTDGQRHAVVRNVMFEKPLNVVGDELGVTRERARQLRNAGMARLRARLDPVRPTRDT